VSQVRKRRSNPPSPLVDGLCVLAGAIGVLGLALALGMACDLGELSDRHALVLSLPDAADAAPGETAILDGRIAASVPALHDEFVAYRRERNARRGWDYLDGGKQPLTVEAGSKTYSIANADYEFDRSIGWTDQQRDDEPPTFSTGGIRIEGLIANGPVTAIGQPMPTDGMPRFRSQSIVGLSRAVYTERLSRTLRLKWQLAGGFAMLAVLGLAIGWRGVRRMIG
jgi:hypothetical protein